MDWHMYAKLFVLVAQDRDLRCRLQKTNSKINYLIQWRLIEKCLSRKLRTIWTCIYRAGSGRDLGQWSIATLLISFSASTVVLCCRTDKFVFVLQKRKIIGWFDHV